MIKKILASTAIFCFSFALLIPFSYSAGNDSESLRVLEEMGGQIGMPVIKKSSTSQIGSIGGKSINVTLNTQSGINTLSRFISEGIKYVAVLAMIAITWGGIMYVTSYGEDKKIASAKRTILYSLLAIILAIGAYAIIDVINNLSLG